MGATKNDLINQQVKDSPTNCPDCKVNWDIKAYELCRKHFQEYEQHQEESRAFAALLAQENGEELQSEFFHFSGAIK